MISPTKLSSHTSVTLSEDVVSGLRRSMAACANSPGNFDRNMNQFACQSSTSAPAQNTTLTRRVTPTGDDESEGATPPSGGCVGRLQANSDSKSLAEAIKQYEIARLNLEAQINARKGTDSIAISGRIKDDFGIRDSPTNKTKNISCVPPPSLSRKQTISAKTRSIGLHKIRQSAIEAEKENSSLAKPHRSAQGYHGTLCLKSNLVEEDGEEDDDATMHVGFSDQWDDAMMAKAMHESKMMAMAQNEQKHADSDKMSSDLATKLEEELIQRALEESKRMAANEGISVGQGNDNDPPQHKSVNQKNTQGMLLSNLTQGTNSKNTERNMGMTPGFSHQPSSALNDQLAQLAASDFANQNPFGHSKFNGNSFRMDQLVNDYQALMRQAEVEQANANASLQSLLPLHSQLGLPDHHVSPFSMNSIANTFGGIHNSSLPIHSLMMNPMIDLRLQQQQQHSVLKKILQIQNQQDMDAYSKASSNPDYSNSEQILFNGGLQQLSYGNNSDLSIPSQQRNMFARDTDQAGRRNDDLSIRRDEVNFLKKRSISNSNCAVCRGLISPHDNPADPLCTSCSFLRKKARQDPCLNESTMNGLTQKNVLTVSSEKWDTIPLDSIVLLATDCDVNWLSDLLCYIRRQIEVFTATPSDVAARSRRGGIKQPIAVGRVGIRCIHCRHINPDHRAKGAVSYPNSIRIVHQAIRNWQRYHFMQCSAIPEEIKITYRGFKTTRSHSGNASLKYWVTSCKKLGMVDTDPENGIRYKAPRNLAKKDFDSKLQLMNKSRLRQESFDEVNKFNKSNHQQSSVTQDVQKEKSGNFFNETIIVPYRKLPDSLLEAGDEKLISPFLALLLSQQQPTHYTAIDTLGKRKSRPINFVGVECRHCSDRVAGSGRYFPLTVTTFANNNNPNNCIHIHMMKCTRCPPQIKDEFLKLQNSKIPDELKLENGWKKKFFDRLWIRLHGKRCTSSEVSPNDEVEVCRFENASNFKTNPAYGYRKPSDDSSNKKISL